MFNKYLAGSGIVSSYLFGKRHDDPDRADPTLYGEDTCTTPGGKLRFGESFADGSKRKVMEETSIKLNSTRIINVNNDLKSESTSVRDPL